MAGDIEKPRFDPTRFAESSYFYPSLKPLGLEPIDTDGITYSHGLYTLPQGADVLVEGHRKGLNEHLKIVSFQLDSPINVRLESIGRNVINASHPSIVIGVFGLNLQRFYNEALIELQKYTTAGNTPPSWTLRRTPLEMFLAKQRALNDIETGLSFDTRDMRVINLITLLSYAPQSRNLPKTKESRFRRDY